MSRCWNKRAVSCLLIPGCLMLGSGCSYAFVHGPRGPVPTSENPGELQRAAPNCTSSNAAPVVDTVLGSSLIGLGGAAVIAASTSHSSSSTTNTSFLLSSPYASSSFNNSSFEAAGVAATVGVIGLGTLFLASAVTGYGRTADCRRLEETRPGGPHPSARHLLDLNGIVAARSREEHERP